MLDVVIFDGKAKLLITHVVAPQETLRETKSFPSSLLPYATLPHLEKLQRKSSFSATLFRRTKSSIKLLRDKKSELMECWRYALQLCVYETWNVICLQSLFWNADRNMKCVFEFEIRQVLKGWCNWECKFWVVSFLLIIWVWWRSVGPCTYQYWNFANRVLCHCGKCHFRVNVANIYDGWLKQCDITCFCLLLLLLICSLKP